MADKVEFELVSPERLLVSQPVDMVVVPGGEGDFGVLPGHAPLISTVRAGVIEIYEGAVERQLREAQQDISDAPTADARASAERRARLAEAKLQAVRRVTVH